MSSLPSIFLLLSAEEAQMQWKGKSPPKKIYVTILIESNIVKIYNRYGVV
jgi:hypothetical protein